MIVAAIALPNLIPARPSSNEIAAIATLRAGGNIGSISGELATGGTGRDGNLWKPVQD